MARTAAVKESLLSLGALAVLTAPTAAMATYWDRLLLAHTAMVDVHTMMSDLGILRPVRICIQLRVQKVDTALKAQQK